MLILAIETSCDETAAAVVRNGAEVLSNVIASQIDIHRVTNGVVPEVAAREHTKQLPYIYQQALSEAKVTMNEIDAIAATESPGLIGSLLVGMQTARTLALVHNKKYIPINHINGHVFSNWLERDASEIEFPVVTLTVSGGHTDLYLVDQDLRPHKLGQTLDDAAGEAFDKVAKMLGLAYPGGPAIASLAAQGDKLRFPFPEAKTDQPLDFSFSGIKTSVLYRIRDLGGELDQKTKADIAASFQATVTKTLAKKLLAAAKKYRAKQIHLAGGVSANQHLRELLLELKPNDTALLYPKQISYCTDNAAMIAAAAFAEERINS